MGQKITILGLCLILLLVNISYAEYIDSNNSTIMDSSTGLIWQKHGTYETYTREDANTYINQLTINNYTNWRLPTVNELIGIKDYIISLPDFKNGDTYHSNEPSSNTIGVHFTSDNYKIILIKTAKILAVCDPFWYSFDPNNYTSIKNTIWKFSSLSVIRDPVYIKFYDIYYQNDTTTKSPDPNSTHRVTLKSYGTNSNLILQYSGMTEYRSYLVGQGIGFVCSIASPLGYYDWFDVYQFSINGNIAIGQSFYKYGNVLGPIEYIQGIKVATIPFPPTPIPPDNNGLCFINSLFNYFF